MDFREVMERRSSCRKFRPDPIDPETLRELVRLAGLAPSPANAQPWRFIAVSNKTLLETMAAEVRRRTEEVFPAPRTKPGRAAFERLLWFSTFFAEAPVVIFAALSPYRAVAAEALEGHAHPTHDEINAMRQQPDLQCLGAAIEHLLLAATGLGLAGCWLAAPLVARREMEQILGLTPPWRLASLVAVGRPALLLNTEKERKPLEQIFELIP